MRLIFILCLLSFNVACDRNAVKVNSNVNAGAKPNASSPVPEKSMPVYSYEIINTFKHDPKAFTQGLFFKDGYLFESTGEYGSSTIRKVELETGKVILKKDVDKNYFAEGMTVLGGKIYQITWKEGTCFVYDEKSFAALKEFRYKGEGWGLTNDGKNLIMSDGTHIIKFVDPETFETVKSLAVMQENGKPLYLLNELEYIKGEIWANIWHSEDAETQTPQGRFPNIGKPNRIARIDPQSGKVVGWVDLDRISPEDSGDGENTLNGIAYDAGADRIFVTGKEWKKLFEIKLKAR